MISFTNILIVLSLFPAIGSASTQTLTVVSLFYNEGVLLDEANIVQEFSAKYNGATTSTKMILDPEPFEKQLTLSASVYLRKTARYEILDSSILVLPKKTLRKFLHASDANNYSAPLINHLIRSAKNKVDFVLAIVPSDRNHSFSSRYGKFLLNPGGFGLIYRTEGRLVSLTSYGLVLLDVNNEKTIDSINAKGSRKVNLKRPLTISERQNILKWINEEIDELSEKFSLTDIPQGRILTAKDELFLKSRLSDEGRDNMEFLDVLLNPQHHSIDNFDRLSEEDRSEVIETIKTSMSQTMTKALKLLIPEQSDEEDL